MRRQHVGLWISAILLQAANAPCEEVEPVAIERSPATQIARKYDLSVEEHALLEEIEHGCFLFMWREVGEPAALVKDRLKANVSSLAAVGFQLSSLPIGVERGWITEEEGRQRAETILRSLISRSDNKKFGIYLHFVDQNTGGPKPDSPESQTSTIDHALLAAGAIPAASYFGGQVARYVDQLLRDANWKAYVHGPEGYLSMGWKPNQGRGMEGPGAFSPWTWKWASSEEFLVYLLAIGAPTAEFRVDPATFYRLQRRFMRHQEQPPFVVSWNGSLFTYFFAHCWIDFGRYGPDRPAEFGLATAPVDWFENSRRAVLVHQQRCREAAARFKTLGGNRWGLSPCMGYKDDGTESYLVPELRPSVADRDQWCGGTVAPYAAASAITLTPAESMAALREMRHLEHEGQHIAWRDPGQGGYGFVDSFNLDQGRAQDDLVGIDVGPMLLALENVRTGLIWRLFHQHDAVRRAVQLLRFQPESAYTK